MFTKTAILAVVLAFPAMATDLPKAPSGPYEQDNAHTSVTWRINHFGLSNYTARFTTAKAHLIWNQDKPANSALEVEIEPTSVKTDFPYPDKEDFDVKIGLGAEFLAGESIRFVSRRIVIDGERSGKVTGDLTLRGKTHPIVMDVIFNGSMAEHPIEKHPKLGFSGHLVIQRSLWGLDFASPALGDEVDVAVEIEFQPSRQKQASIGGGAPQITRSLD